jgi:hypothetical protein
MKDELKGSNKQETMDISPNEDKDLATIRYFHSSFENFFNYWKKRGVETDPYKGVELIHPVKKVQKESTLPIQDFGTYDKSEMNKKLTESFVQFITESKEI